MVSSAQLEVEQKFAILGRNMDELQGQIRQAGFELDASIQMVDWYFDAKGSSVLAVRDHWLKYRQVTDRNGDWQLKRGQPKGRDEGQPKGLTAY
jgi:inorganic triphosphatase YgiF